MSLRYWNASYYWKKTCFLTTQMNFLKTATGTEISCFLVFPDDDYVSVWENGTESGTQSSLLFHAFFALADFVTF